MTTAIIKLFIMATILAYCISFVAFVFIGILQQPPHIFFGFRKWMNKVLNEKRWAQGKEDHPIYTILCGCEACLAGELSLWLYFFMNVAYGFRAKVGIIMTGVIGFYCISLSILLALIIKKYYEQPAKSN